MSVTQEGYRNYLLARPMTANTVNSYCAGINHLARHCGLELWTISDLELLDGLLADYDVAGELADIGNYGNGTARNALRQWRDYVASTAEEDGLSVESATQLFWLSLTNSERQWAQWIVDKVTSLFPQADQWINKGPIWAVGVKPISAKKAISQVIRVARDSSKVLWCSVMQSGKPLFGITLEDKRGGSFYQANTLEDVTAWFDDTALPHIESNQLNLDGQANRPDDYAVTDTNTNTLTISLTDGAIRSGCIRIPKAQSLIPEECIEFQHKPAARLFSISLPNGNVVETKVLGERGFLQARFNALFARAKLKEGDCARLTRLASYSYEMQFLHQGEAQVKLNPTVLGFTQSLEPDMPLIPLNQILFGPPGTGKTYNTINKALAILDPDCLEQHRDDESPEARKALKARFDELVKEGRIDFVTFHQSFSYEDFVEGIRAESDGESGQLTYDVVDGVFKRMCDAVAAKVTRSDSHEAMTLEGRRVWKMSLGNTKGGDAHIFDDCIAEGLIRLGYGGKHDYSECKTREEVQTLLEQSVGKIDNAYDYTVTSVVTLVTRMKRGDLVVVTDGNLKFRAIGEIIGDYQLKPHPDYSNSYAQVRPVKWLCQYSTSLSSSELIDGRFSQMTLYELKVPTLLPEKLLALLNTAASQAGSQSEAGATPSNKRVLIIDEINRGNVSRIFGELITLIEPSKRAGASEALTTTLPYSKRPFSVPDNLYLIGTMNTADRSLAGLDIALRRRFVFEEMPPRADFLDGVVIEEEGHKVDVGRLLHTLNQRIEVLLDRDHCLGHAYFMSLKAAAKPTMAQLASIFQHQILPLLQEYFFEDWQRIAWVLNDHRKNEPDTMFLHEPDFDIEDLLGKVPVGKQRLRWTVNPNAFENPAAYVLTIKGDREAK
ncbi:AAA family ATPase [Aeromonas hydrophila]|uniref:AAA family ATPase n=1 Tax=Aeromonas hydrophila TaxID=644 RepID=UPI003BD5862E